MTDFGPARQLILNGAQTAFPAAVIDVGRHDRVIWQEPFGVLSRELDAPPTQLDTIFDLASLTKVLATTTLAMAAVDARRLTVDDFVSHWLPKWRDHDRRNVTVADLLAHVSGLTAHLPFFRNHRGRAEFESAICSLPLKYPPRSQSTYSDLGFILLGFLLADASGATLDAQFNQLVTDHKWGEINFRPDFATRSRIAPTEVDPWRGRLLVGEVDDENTWALGGVAGHAGLFGTASAVGRFAQTILRQARGNTSLAQPETFRRFITPTTAPKSSRALGWDTMLPTSSCGTRMSASAIGHTGFTGTSLWIDFERDLYVVLLTNRVYPSRTNEEILRVRPAFHDAIMTALA
jgi:CubicO group peptidase (beta-lactamase class C family)